MKKPILIAGLVFTALTLVAIVVMLSSGTRGPLQVGDKAPDFELVGAFGGQGKLSDLRGQFVILNFWATWCSPCVEEMPSLQRLHRAYDGDDFEIVAVSLDAEGAPVVQSFAERYKLEFSLAVDPDKKTETIYGLTGLPETYIIDKEGVIVEKILGPRDWASAETVEKMIKLVGRYPRRGRAVTDATGAVTGATAPVTGPAEAR